eukprot:comp21294_c0_seq1/m.29085 comp21294_c0_seq1/g.29085  ORF comp21294_c0_seq1/g.29085 comp21294_c0_seq1/m.29085 type:complete len:713 (-) comp21294_c0_seq1:33-2171(-)
MNALGDTTNRSGLRPPGGIKPPAASRPSLAPSQASAVPAPSGLKRKADEDPSPAGRNVRSKLSPSVPATTAGARTAVKPVPRTTSTVAGRAPVTRPSAVTGRTTTAATRPGATRTATATSARPTAAATKVQPWDTKGRMALMEDELRNMKTQVQANNEQMRTEMEAQKAQIEELLQQRQVLETTVQVKDQEKSATAERVDQLERDLKMEREARAQEQAHHVAEVTRMRLSHQSEVSALTQSLEDSRQQNQSLLVRISSKDAEITEMSSTITRMTTTNAETSTRLRLTQSQLETTERLAEERGNEISLLKQEMEKRTREYEEKIEGLNGDVRRHLERIAECEQKIREDETIRRKLHNSIQELRGNVRVFCRVRPPLGAETEDVGYIQFGDSDNRAIKLSYAGEANSLGKVQQKTFEFNFDCVFPPTSNQSAVFEEISQLVQSALDGYNVCIFAYGQTGSGKTYTMEGPQPINSAPPEAMGMIPRAIVQIFEAAAALLEKGWEYKFETDFLEIYNESLRDLLDDNTNKKLDIKIRKENPNETYVPDVTRMAVTRPDMVHQLLARACANRATAATMCNIQSSRSHSVFRLHITGTNDITGEKISSVLNLIDLAGSERVNQSGATGDRLKETQAINKSLSNLGSVIQALANKEQHVPYRNSKLTYLLQNSLGGNSKTLMFVNVSPKADCYSETISSLRFAAKVNECDIGTARKVIK